MHTISYVPPTCSILPFFRDNNASIQHKTIPSDRGDTNELAIMGTLHELSNDFPGLESDSGVGGGRSTFRNHAHSVSHAALHMTSLGCRILDRVYQFLLVPRVFIRLATVSEITSNIL